MAVSVLAQCLAAAAIIRSPAQCLPPDCCLLQVGIKNPEVIGKASVRNDALFLITVVLTTSAIAVPAQLLPGDWVSPRPSGLPNWCTLLQCGAQHAAAVCQASQGPQGGCSWMQAYFGLRP